MKPLLLSAAVAIGVALVYSIHLSRVFRLDFARRGRFIEWKDLTARLIRGEGQLIVNHSNVDGRVYWSPVVSSLADIYAQDLLTLNIFLTNCPYWLARVSALRRKFPKTSVIVCSGCVRVS